MVRRIRERMQAIGFAAVLIVAIAGLYGMVQVFQPASVPQSAVHGVRLTVDSGEWAIEFRIDETRNNTAFALLLEAADTLGFAVQHEVYQIPAGVLVTAINGSVNGADGRYWLYWVNRVYGEVAADKFPLADNDAVLWRFDRSYGAMPSS